MSEPCKRCGGPQPNPKPPLVSGSCIECHGYLCSQIVETRAASDEFARARGYVPGTVGPLYYLCSLRPGHAGRHWNRAIGYGAETEPRSGP